MPFCLVFFLSQQRNAYGNPDPLPVIISRYDITSGMKAVTYLYFPGKGTLFSGNLTSLGLLFKKNILFSLFDVFLLQQEQYSFMIFYTVSRSGVIEFNLIPSVIREIDKSPSLKVL